MKSRLQKYFDLYYGFMLFITISAIAAIGLLQPDMADDFNVFNHFKRGQGLFEFIGSWYLNLTGRVQGSVIWWIEMQHQYFRYAVKSMHGIMLIGIAYLCLLMALGRRPNIFKNDRIAFLLTLAMFWFGLPFLSEVVFWDNCSALYLMPVFFGLTFLVPYRIWLENNNDDIVKETKGFKPSIVCNIGIFLLGLWVGLGHEQLDLQIAAFLVIFWLLLFKKVKGASQIPSWLIYGTIGFIIGVIILVLAPGNFVRLSGARETSFFRDLVVFIGYLFFILIANAWKDWWPWIAAVALLTLSVTGDNNGKSENKADAVPGRMKNSSLILIWTCIGFASLVPILFLSSFLVDRASFFAIVFWNIAILTTLRNDNFHKCNTGTNKDCSGLSSSKAVYLVTILLINMMAIDALLGVHTAYKISQEIHVREQLINTSLHEGITTVLVPPLKTKFRRTTYIRDITTDPKNWINKTEATYYGLNTIRLSEDNQNYYDIKTGEVGQYLRYNFRKYFKNSN